MQTIDHRLRSVIEGLMSSARTSKIISINAALLSEQLLHGRLQDTAALKVVAAEIQRLSDESTHGIAALHATLEDIKLLTQTINLAGRQRMLSQKIMKLFLLQRSGAPAEVALDYGPLIVEFQTSLTHLQRCGLNTPEIHTQLGRAAEVWQAFLRALRRDDTATAAALNERVLQEIHTAVQHYEELGGGRPAAA